MTSERFTSWLAAGWGRWRVPPPPACGCSGFSLLPTQSWYPYQIGAPNTVLYTPPLNGGVFPFYLCHGYCFIRTPVPVESHGISHNPWDIPQEILTSHPISNANSNANSEYCAAHHPLPPTVDAYSLFVDRPVPAAFFLFVCLARLTRVSGYAPPIFIGIPMEQHHVEYTDHPMGYPTRNPNTITSPPYTTLRPMVVHNPPPPPEEYFFLLLQARNGVTPMFFYFSSGQSCRLVLRGC